jgi:hypothetical protein
MRSTYDRAGNNEAADASHFLYQLADYRNVTLDLAGPGMLYFARYNHWHGSPWRYIVDGSEHIIFETSTADPDHPIENSTFLPKESFPPPLAFTWSTTKGADLCWVPIPFEKSFQMQYSHTHYGTGYYIFHRYVPGIPLSQPIRLWDAAAPPQDILKLLSQGASFPLLNASPTGGMVNINPNQSAELVHLTNGPATIRSFVLSIPRDLAFAAAQMRLRMTWDNRAEPSVDAPLALFFGAGTLYNRDDREIFVKAFPSQIRFDARRVILTSFLPMPFFRLAKIELLGGLQPVTDLQWSVYAKPSDLPPNHLAYFHATYRDHPHPEPGKDLIFLDTRNLEGSADWSGSFIGTSFIFSHNATLSTLEGDPRFFFDDSNSPQAYGTGTEEWAGGGDYWGGENMTLPFAGHPCGARSIKEAKSEEDRIESAYRFLLADLFPFGKNARIQLEHGGTNQSTEHYETVTFWYGLPAASLVQTDFLQIGDPESERSHQYNSPAASEPYTITSRYELGPDHVKDTEIFPATTDRGRTTAGTTEFTIKLDPDNLGVLLRRKLDYSFPNQRAEVSVAALDDPGSPADRLDFHPAGVWYLAGSNTCVYSNPKDELGPAQHIVQTSNRRFREDEFLIPLSLTQHHGFIRIRLRFSPVKIPLFPGEPLPPLAWSEINYAAYVFKLPSFIIQNEHDGH